jgi:sugar phosphate isomerase/epimerase
MIQRRKFIRDASLLGIGTGLSLRSIAQGLHPMAGRPMGIQLFTFFGAIDKDLTGTLQKIKAAGYTEIESAFSMKGGFYGLGGKEFRKTLEDMGLSWTSHHAIGAPLNIKPEAMPPGADGKPFSMPPMKNLRDNYQEIVDDAAAGGVPYLVCANIPIETADQVKAAVDILGKAAEAAKKAGLIFAYHNHDAEFRAVEGLVPYDHFLSQLPADKVKMELDLAWCIKAGKDPVALFDKHLGRFPLWHVKDLDKEGKILPVGAGTIDFKRIFAAAGKSGMKHFFVEHDFPQDAEASIKASSGYLKSII